MSDRSKYIGKKIAKGLCFVVVGILLVILFGNVVMYLWNWLVPALFAGPVITFWQALGLLVLTRILFGFPKGGGHRGGGWARKKREWKEEMRARMEHLTPEEKEKMKDHFSRCMSGRWGRWAEKNDRDNVSPSQPD